MEWNGLQVIAATINVTAGLFVSPDMADAMKAVAPEVLRGEVDICGLPVMVTKLLPPGSYLLIPLRLEGEATKDWVARWEGNIGEEVNV